MSRHFRIMEDQEARTDLTIEERAEEFIREHLLDHVHDEIPYTTEIEVKYVLLLPLLVYQLLAKFTPLLPICTLQESHRGDSRQAAV